MTNAIYDEAMAYIKKIDEMGGAVVAIEKGYIQKKFKNPLTNGKWKLNLVAHNRWRKQIPS